jgi:hypothetical protein
MFFLYWEKKKITGTLLLFTRFPVFFLRSEATTQRWKFWSPTMWQVTSFSRIFPAAFPDAGQSFSSFFWNCEAYFLLPVPFLYVTVFGSGLKWILFDSFLQDPDPVLYWERGIGSKIQLSKNFTYQGILYCTIYRYGITYNLLPTLKKKLLKKNQDRIKEK